MSDPLPTVPMYLYEEALRQRDVETQRANELAALLAEAVVSRQELSVRLEELERQLREVDNHG